MDAGELKVDRAALTKLLMEQQGLSADAAGRVALRARVTIQATVHRACVRCGGYTAPNLLMLRRAEESPNTYPCTCPQGPKATVEDRGVISDSGPRKLIPRLLWRAQQALKRRT